MAEGTVSSDVKSLWKWIGGSAFLASMCCFPSVVLVMFGLASISSAAALSNDLYWGTNGMGWFRPMLLVLSTLLVLIGLVMYFRKEGICSLDEARRQRKRILNTSLLVLSLSLVSYIVFNFVILTEIGVALDLPWESSRLWN
ncbi:MAG: hypothetical protein VX518_03745 [Candidatus Thermoplasmatota archaeon]|nr:hypothetical protein [Candidatus Thermoplasmatota archaeon]GIR76611.1 MAG: hypothetical protein CM15mP78_13100 [Candidatus Poseidoniales archaeon]MEC7601117.1 hypothetical protein [Candidatus Thermoplasmatota archaeon]MEC7626090.1 hypothetical protein [Candidatus Thermoplasmatota archaeon]MEC8816400.1 hypothetical protein [Candidatus Thermoplasmatota archaeon]|tara:strand:- start:344 stop:769 length:426 start_codon:yes stop_codon:yes gene_type:complete